MICKDLKSDGFTSLMQVVSMPATKLVFSCDTKVRASVLEVTLPLISAWFTLSHPPPYLYFGDTSTTYVVFTTIVVDYGTMELVVNRLQRFMTAGEKIQTQDVFPMVMYRPLVVCTGCHNQYPLRLGCSICFGIGMLRVTHPNTSIVFDGDRSIDLTTLLDDEVNLRKYVNLSTIWVDAKTPHACLLYTSPSPRDGLLSRMPSSA